MSANPSSTKQKVLQERYEALEADYIAANQEMLQTRGAVERNQLNRKAEDLYEQMLKTERELKELKLSPTNNLSSLSFNEYEKEWKDNFHNINFENAIDIVNNIFKKFRNKELATFLLLQNSTSMGGEWCIKRINLLLKNYGLLKSIFNIRFLSIQKPSPFEFLKKVGNELGPHRFEKYYNNNYQQNFTDFCSEIIDAICEPIDHGKNILLLEVYLESNKINKIFLDWLLHFFWKSLLSKQSYVRKRNPRVKIVMVVAVDISISQDDIPSNFYCDEHNFDSKKIVNLPLNKCSEEEIINWLFNFSGFSGFILSEQDIKEMAYSIYQSSEGKPPNVQIAMFNELKKIYKEISGI